jgi:hypothetical protein
MLKRTPQTRFSPAAETSEEWWRPHHIIFDELKKPWPFPCVQRPDATSCPDEEAQAIYRELAAAVAASDVIAARSQRRLKCYAKTNEMRFCLGFRQMRIIRS